MFDVTDPQEVARQMAQPFRMSVRRRGVPVSRRDFEDANDQRMDDDPLHREAVEPTDPRQRTN